METTDKSSAATTTSTVSKLRQIPSPMTHLSFMASQFGLRVLAAATTLVAAWLMLTNKQSKVLFGMTMEARYTYSSAIKFFVFVNVVTCALTVLSLFPVFILGRKFSNSISYFFLFLHDLVLTIFLMAGCAAATAIGYVGKHGIKQSGWLPICDHFERFCEKGAASVILSYLGTLCYVFLTIISAHKSRQIIA